MLTAEAASMLKLKNSNDDDIVLDSSLLEDVIVGIGLGAMDSNSPNVGMSNDDDNNDVYRCHLVGLLFWVQTLESNIPTALSLDPLDMSMAQRNFVSHYYSAGGGSGGGGGGDGSRRARCKGNVVEEEVEEDNDGFSSLGGHKR